VTIIDFPRGGKAGRSAGRAATAAHPTARYRAGVLAAGAPPSGQWLVTYEELAACCAEVVAGARVRVYDAEWEELLDWIRSRLSVLDALKAAEAGGGVS
jgi:hypothetical protein